MSQALLTILWQCVQIGYYFAAFTIDKMWMCAAWLSVIAFARSCLLASSYELAIKCSAYLMLLLLSVLSCVDNVVKL